MKYKKKNLVLLWKQRVGTLHQHLGLNFMKMFNSSDIKKEYNTSSQTTDKEYEKVNFINYVTVCLRGERAGDGGNSKRHIQPGCYSCR